MNEPGRTVASHWRYRRQRSDLVLNLGRGEVPSEPSHLAWGRTMIRILGWSRTMVRSLFGCCAIEIVLAGHSIDVLPAHMGLEDPGYHDHPV